MAKKTHEEEQKENAYQRDLGKRGHTTGSAANTQGYKEYLAKQEKAKMDKDHNKAFEKAAKSTGGCMVLILATATILMTATILISAIAAIS